MKRKILTLEDLAKFCRERKLYSFSKADNNGEPLCVSMPAMFKKKEEKDSLLMYATIKAFHTNRNRNDSAVTEEAMEKSKSTFANKPILAAFTTDKNGDEDFMAHEIEQDADGNVVYIERQVGNFTEDEPWIEPDEEDENKNWIFATAAIPREYTHAADIIERKGGTKVSVELIVNKFSYDENEDLLLLEDIEVSGLTLLGVYEEGADPETESVEEGMKGARLDIADFSKKNNSSFDMDELTNVIKDVVGKTLQDINNQRKEENNQMNHFEELLQKYGKKVEEITFAYEGLSDEELDAAFAEAFEEAPTPEGGEPQTENVEFTVAYKGASKNFVKSLNEQIRAISELVNAQYGAEDNTWYDVEVFDDHTVYMHDWWNGKHFKQKYGNKDGELTLKGERTEIFVRYLTEEEIAALDDLKSKFDAQTKEFEEVGAKLAEATKELDLFKAEPDKIKLLDNDDYSKIKNTAEFTELSKRENYFSLSMEDLTQKLDGILLQYAKKDSRENVQQEHAGSNSKRFGFGEPESKSSRYGGIFDINK